MAQHSWTFGDNLVAFYIYRFDSQGLGHSEKEIAEILGIKARSLRMCKQNFQFLATGTGLKNVSYKEKEVYNQCQDMAEPELRALAIKEIDKVKKRLKAAVKGR